MINKGADVNATSKITNTTPLILAAANGHTAVVKTLLDAHANVNHRNTKGQNALMHAAIWGYEDVVRLLLAHGANVQAKNYQGKTAQDLAKEGRTPTGKSKPKGHIAIIRELIQAGRKK